MKKTIVFALCTMALSLIVISTAPASARASGDNSKAISAPATSDAAISDAVRAGIDADSVIVNPGEISVSVDQGVVTFTGEVGNSSEVERVEQIALAIPGVTKVDNQLTVEQ